MTTPEEEAALRFQTEMLAQIQREFYRGKTSKEFFQERNMLLKAITHPSDWLKQRGVERMAPSQYRQILQTVLATIRTHGQRPAKMLRFSAYLLHCVQEHMKHQGDGYYYAAKEVRSVGTMLPKTMRELKAGDSSGTFLGVLSAVNKTLRSKGGRRKRRENTRVFSEPDLFANDNESVRPQRAAS